MRLGKKSKSWTEQIKTSLFPSPSERLKKELLATAKTLKAEVSKAGSSRSILGRKAKPQGLQRAKNLGAALSDAVKETQSRHGGQLRTGFEKVSDSALADSKARISSTAKNVNEVAKQAAQYVAARSVEAAKSTEVNAIKKATRNAVSASGRFTTESAKKVTQAIPKAKKERGTLSGSGRKIADKTVQLYNAAISTEAGLSADRWLRDAFSGAPDVYDRAMDAAREATGHLGPDHRLFDGGHSLVGAWDRVKNALPDDSSAEQIRGCLDSLKNDLITPMGLPVATLNKEQFDRFVELTWVDSTWAKDMASFTATEAIGATTGALALLFNWKEDDIAAFSKTAGSLGVSAIAGANPLLATVSLSALAYKYQQAKGSKQEVAKEAMKGATPTAVFVAAAGVVGGPAWIGAVAGAAACIATARALGDEDYDKAADYIKRKSAVLMASASSWTFPSFKEASVFAKSHAPLGASVKRAPDGEGYIVVLKN